MSKATMALLHFLRITPARAVRRKPMTKFHLMVALYRGGYGERDADAAVAWLARNRALVVKGAVCAAVTVPLAIMCVVSTLAPALSEALLVGVGFAIGFAVAVWFLLTAGPALPEADDVPEGGANETWSGLWPRDDTLRITSKGIH